MLMFSTVSMSISPPLQLVKLGMINGTMTLKLIHNHESSSDSDYRVGDHRQYAQQIQEVCQAQHFLRGVNTEVNFFLAAEVAEARQMVLENIQREKGDSYHAITKSYGSSSTGVVDQTRALIMAEFAFRTIKVRENSASAATSDRSESIAGLVNDFTSYWGPAKDISSNANIIAALHEKLSIVLAADPVLRVRCEEHYAEVRTMMTRFTATLLSACDSPAVLDIQFNRPVLFSDWHHSCMESMALNFQLKLGDDQTLQMPRDWLKTFDCFFFSKEESKMIESAFVKKFPFFKRPPDAAGSRDSVADTGYTRKLFVTSVTLHMLREVCERDGLGVSTFWKSSVERAMKDTFNHQLHPPKNVPVTALGKKTKRKPVNLIAKAVQDEKREWAATTLELPRLREDEARAKVSDEMIRSDVDTIRDLAAQVRASLVYHTNNNVQSTRCNYVATFLTCVCTCVAILLICLLIAVSRRIVICQLIAIECI